MNNDKKHTDLSPADLSTADQSTADQSTADQSTADQSTADKPPRISRVTLPDRGPDTISILDFLTQRFPFVDPAIWRERLAEDKLSFQDGEIITPETPYTIGAVICYRRESKNEPELPFDEELLYQDEHLLVAFKPHFMPVTPSGLWVRQCLLYRLIESTGLKDLSPVHRLDRETAGLVLFSILPKTRSQYHLLFEHGKITRRYEAIGTLPSEESQSVWTIESRIEKGNQFPLMAEVDGEINARTKIQLIDQNSKIGQFALSPSTGKKHQLRLHMMHIGAQILNDRFYPNLQPQAPDDRHHPLQLMATSLSFADPISGRKMEFSSPRTLQWPPPRTAE